MVGPSHGQVWSWPEVLRTCSKSSEQQNQKGQMDELQASIEQPLAVLP